MRTRGAGCGCGCWPGSAAAGLLLAAVAGNVLTHYRGWSVKRLEPDALSAMLAPAYRVLKPAGDGPFPTALLFSGCDGPRDNVERWAERLNAIGWAAVVVDSHGPRGLDGREVWRLVCAGQILMGSERAGDVLIAIDDVRRMPFADPGRLALIGASHGGWAIMDLLAMGPPERLPYNLAGLRPDAPADPLAGVVGVILLYPYCGEANLARDGGWRRRGAGAVRSQPRRLRGAVGGLRGDRRRAARRGDAGGDGGAGGGDARLRPGGARRGSVRCSSTRRRPRRRWRGGWRSWRPPGIDARSRSAVVSIRLYRSGESAMRGRGGVVGGLAAGGLAVLLGLATPPALAQAQLTVFAAASLKNALDAVSAAWTAETGKTATISYAASSALAKQIEEGAPADVFVSADLDWMAYLSERGLIRKDSEVRLLGNRIVLIAPADSAVTAEIAPGFDLAALLGDGRLAMANVDAVPAGKYGKAALTSLGAWDGVADKVAQAENVRAALALVSTGEAPLGIVYRTDAAADPAVRIVGTFPEDSHPPIVYPAAVTSEAKSADAAAFLAFLQSETAAGLFEAQGFEVLAPAPLTRRGGADGVAAPQSGRMDRRPPLDQGLDLGDAGQPAFRHPGRAPAGAARVPGQGAAQRRGAPAADPAAGGHRLPAASDLRAARAGGRVPRGSISASSSPSAGPAPRSPAGSWRFR